MKSLYSYFRIPFVVLIGILLHISLRAFHQDLLANGIAIAVTVLGSYDLFIETYHSLREKKYALDYIAILAIITSFVTGEYIVAAVIALMLSSGRTLEDYGVSKAKESLTKLADRIPNEVTLWQGNHADGKEKIGNIVVGQEVFIRKGEVIVLDSVLISEMASVDESSMTGEPYPVDKIAGDPLTSGTVNVGEPIAIRVIKSEADSMYRKIVTMVQHAQEEKSPLVRLADKYSTIFTLLTLVIAGFSYWYSGYDLTRVLAVLVVATPCPLILATPIALLAGVNAASKERIIIKKLAAIEVLSRVRAMIFDKTGTITLGKPTLAEFKNTSRVYSDEQLLSFAEAVERNSLHPLAKTIVAYAKERHVPVLHATNVSEKIGEGIAGDINNHRYRLARPVGGLGMQISLYEGESEIATFRFDDEIKEHSRSVITALKEKGIEVFIYTGDKLEAAQHVVAQLGEDVHIKAECTPEDKQKGIRELKDQGKVVAMVGDGINDAPALALADAGMVFSNEEQTAASEAADVVFLGGNFTQVVDALRISQRTIKIAMQSILWGIGLSIVAMIAASLGYVPPVVGALIQEAIDVIVILNALRAVRLSK